MTLAPVNVSRDELVGLRRELHQAPELAFEEHKTAARITSHLSGQQGLTLRTGLGGTGVLATAGGTGGKHGAVLLRVDMDALPLQETTGAPYASRTPGVMHACGHDGHVAMGAVAARALGERELPRPVHVLFQPAEEGHGGARAVVDDGVMDGVERVFGVHLWNELPVGVIGVKPGPLMAAVDRLTIAVTGRGGHGASPHRTADPIVASSHVIVALQTIVSREAAAAVVGEANVVVPETTMGGEDVSEYLERAPGCFVFIGSSNAQKGLSEPHHSPRFDFDEDALTVGCQFLVRAAERALAR
jgi:amidohydrolase